jgi:hypothetical protein
MVVPAPHIQIVLEDQRLPESLATAIRRVGGTASFWSLSDTLRVGLTSSADAIVVVAPSDTPGTAGRLQSLFDRMADRPRATLVLQPEARAKARMAHPPTLPVSFTAGLDADELTAQLATMIEMRRPLESLRGSRTVKRAMEPTVAQAYLQQMRLAGQVQRELLPNALPNYGPVSFTAVYRPAEYVSGDIYDIQRLDGEHLAIGLADVTGHGMAAALLTVFIKRALRGREARAGGDQALQPGEVLGRLNREILEVDFSECTFAAAIYAVLNTRTLRLQLARGGAPYPILRRADGTLRLLRPTGSLIGVQPEAVFAIEEVQLRPGDGLLLYTDGLDRVILPPRRSPRLAKGSPCETSAVGRVAAAAAGESGNGYICSVGSGRPGNSPGRQGLLAPIAGDAGTAPLQESSTTTILESESAAVPPDEIITQSPWYALLGEQGEQAALDHLSFRHDLLRRLGYPLDDLTVLALQIDSRSAQL